MKVSDDYFDSKFLMDMASYLAHAHMWSADNTANRYSYPYGFKGTHLLLGHKIFDKEENYYTENRKVFNLGMQIFKGIEEMKESKFDLLQLSANLQFKGMNGTLHTDGTSEQTAFILMFTNEFIGDNVGGKFINDTVKEEVDFKNGRLIEITASDLHRADSLDLEKVLRFSIKVLVGGNHE